MPVTINGTTGIAGVDGSASTPAVQGTDTNTGIFFPAADTIAFGEGGTEAMRIDSSGNLGLGSTSPSTFDDAGVGKNFVIQSTGAGRGVITFASQQTSGANELLGRINFIDSDSTNTNYRGAQIDGLLGTDANSAFLRFSTANSAAGTERMRITQAGNVGIGSTSPGSTLTVVGSTTGGAVNITNSRSTTDGDTRATSMSLSAIASTNTTEYFAVFYPNGGMIGSIKMNNNAVAFNTTSDVRKKENIVDSESCVDKLKQVKVRNFNWINDENKSNIHGFIAQELHEVYPYAVSVGGEDPEENPWSVDYGRLTPLLTKALQEAMTRIEALEAEVAALKGTN